MNIIASSLFWITIYLIMVLAPLMILNIGEVPPGFGFWWDFSMALGFAGMAMMGVQFYLTARFKRASAPFGIDIIYYFHRYVAISAFTFIFLHFLIIRFTNVDALGSINPLDAPWYMTVGRVSLVLFALLIITSIWRKQLHIDYDRWRIVHIVMAMSAFLLALAHIEGVGYYIAAPAKRWLWTLYTLFWIFLIVYIRIIKPWKMKKNPYQIVEINKEHGNCWNIVVKPFGHSGMCYKPGQFAWLTLKDSPYNIKEHPFSFASSAEHCEKIEFAIKELGDFTRTIKDATPGDMVYLDGPYGAFSIDNYRDAPGFVFITAGIGVAPVMSMLRTLADRHDQRPLWFIDINREWEDVIFREELETMQERLNLKLTYVLSNPHPQWKGESGHISEPLLRRNLPDDLTAYQYFICGPKPMSDAAQKELYAMNVPLRKIHFELFNMV
ncbi:MAG: ferric reductase-like transmembrane domain-containing protein [Sulfurimonadaceae bacterium]